MHTSFSSSAFSTSAFSTLSQNSVSKTDSMTPPAPLTYEEATMGAADALQKAVGQLKEKYPPKSMQQRALETMEEPQMIRESRQSLPKTLQAVRIMKEAIPEILIKVLILTLK